MWNRGNGVFRPKPRGLEELFEKVGCDFLQGDHVRLGRLQGRELTAQSSRAVIFREPGVEGDEPKRTHLGAGL